LAITETPALTVTERIEALYLAALGRKPTTKECDRMVKHVGETKEQLVERLGDVFWVLLNAAEFRLNH
jgi:hypothetical protein